MHLRRGDVRWYTYKAPDKRRPVVVLTRNDALEVLTQVTVASVTSTVRHIPTEVVIDEQDGMLQRCAVNLDHFRTVDAVLLAHDAAYITHLSDDVMDEIRDALLYALGFED